MLSFITLTDGYKLDHRRQYPPGTKKVYSNFTPRSTRVPEQNYVVFFGLQYFLKRYFGEVAQETFFQRPRQKVLDEYSRMVTNYLGPQAAKDIGVDHIGALHELGHLPLAFFALPEGSKVPLRVPMFTVENTHDDFFWLVNYFESLLSNVIWQATTSATTAHRYRTLLDAYAQRTGDPEFVPWQGHDFSFRGMAGPEAGALSGAGHLLSFTGTDTIPAIELLERYYGADGLIGGSVPATEHSVMCAGGKEDERQTFARLMELYPSGVVSVVSDTWDFWKVVDEHLPALKDKIMARDGKLVIRPDSGDPVQILCGFPVAHQSKSDLPQAKGLIECLWDIFGGTVNEKGYKVLDPHIGAIYGDSITYERASKIVSLLERKGFASTNVVLGIGSYTYQHVTRDTYGMAMKATWAQVEDRERFLFKDPKTDDGSKRSATGRMAVLEQGGKLILRDGLSKSDWGDNPRLCREDRLKVVWENGEFTRFCDLNGIRARVQS